MILYKSIKPAPTNTTIRMKEISSAGKFYKKRHALKIYRLKRKWGLELIKQAACLRIYFLSFEKEE